MCATLVFLAVQANQDPVYVEPGTENIVDETQKSIQDLFKMTAKPSDKYSGETCSDGIARPKREALEYVPCNDLKECSIPHCFCTTKGIWPPFRGVKNEHDFPILPQVVVLALEGAVTPNNVRLFREIFDAGLNPDQCMISGTVFTPLKDSNFVLLNELDSRGNEIAFLPGHFTQNDEGYAVIDNEFNFSRVVERYSALHQPIIGVKLPSDILVSEEHYPSVSAHRYVYDATLRAPLRYSPDMKAYEPPVWPYTLHAEIPHACEEHAPYTCPSRSYYLWEVPSNEFSSPIPGACLSLENCPGHPTRNSTLFVQLLETQLQRSLKTNRAPVVLHIRIETLERSRSHRLRLLQWIKDTLQTHSDVYFISVRRMLEWILSDNGKTEWQPIGKSGVCTADSVKTNCAPEYINLDADAQTYFGNREFLPFCRQQTFSNVEEPLGQD
ncbi:chitin deacetylase 1-like [Tigriopus californicus]|nr:chitin deacetylase 1-like [Tigriopus californicus]